MNKGFTLIEIIIYVGLLGIILMLVSGYAWNILQGSTRSTSRQEVQQNARFGLEKIIRTVRAGQDPQNTFSLQDGTLHQNGVPITGEEVEVTAANFTPISNSYKIELALRYRNPENRPEYDANIKVTSSVCSRTFKLDSGEEEGGCQGTATSCADIYDETSCEKQDGCGWAPGSCSGSCTPCSELEGKDCVFQDGCRKFRTTCRGTCKECGEYDKEVFCNDQLECSWSPAYCYGTATPCSNYTSKQACSSQEGCQWIKY